MKRIFLAIAALYLLVPAAMAQRTFSSAPTDSASRQKETIVIVTEANASDFFDKRTPSNIRTSIKLNPLLILSGDIPIYLEQKIATKLTAEAAVGLTYKNYIGDLFDLEYEEYEVKKEDEMGYSFSGALRFYPSDAYDALEGYYFAPEIRHRVYNMRAVECDGQKIDIKQRKTYTDYKLTFGYANFVDDNIVFDFYSGIGIGNRSYKNEIFTESEYNPATYQNEALITTANTEKKVLVFALGVKFGFAF